MYPVAAGMRSKPWGWLSSWVHGRGTHKGVVFLLSEEPGANLTGSCHSAPVCCALFHSDALAGMGKSRMCREGTAGSCLGRSALSPGTGGTRPQHPELSGPLCCHRTVTARHGAVTSPWLQRSSRDVPSLRPALCPDCCWPCCRLRELWGYCAHTVPPHRHSSGVETSLNFTHIHFCLKQALVTSSLHDGIFCATWSWIIVMF